MPNFAPQASLSIREEQLTKEERDRNVLGPILTFQADPESDEQNFCKSTVPKHFPSVTHSRSRCSWSPPPPPLNPGERGFLPVLAKGTITSQNTPPGYPTLRTLKCEAVVQMAGVDVFGRPSQRESAILVVKVCSGFPWV